MSDHDLGGDNACWAHRLDEVDPLPGSGVVWSLPHDGDLDGNFVHLRAGSQIDEHVNADLDVLVVVWSGRGALLVDGAETELGRGVMTVVPKGAARSIRAIDDLRYLSIHRRRDAIGLGRR